MARENEVWLHGQVREPPRITINEEGEMKRAYLYIRVLRRTNVAPGQDANIRIDCPVIRTQNQEMMNIINTLEKGDMIDVKGVISSKDVIKVTICPECNQKNRVSGSLVFVTPIYICRREKKLSDNDGFALLKARNEISNNASVIGTVCKAPQTHEDEKKRFYAEYELAVNRRYHIREDADDVRCDFVYVKAFGKTARTATECLRERSRVFIKASIQTREITRKSICAMCGTEYTWSENVAELVPYYTGFLDNCILPVKQDDTLTEIIDDEEDDGVTEYGEI